MQSQVERDDIFGNDWPTGGCVIVSLFVCGFLFFFPGRITIDFLTRLSFVSVAPLCPKKRNKCEADDSWNGVLLWLILHKIVLVCK